MDCRKIEKLCVLLGRGNKEKGKYLLEDLYDVLGNFEKISKNYLVKKRFDGLCLNATWKCIQELDELRKKKKDNNKGRILGDFIVFGVFYACSSRGGHEKGKAPNGKGKIRAKEEKTACDCHAENKKKGKNKCSIK